MSRCRQIFLLCLLAFLSATAAAAEPQLEVTTLGKLPTSLAQAKDAQGSREKRTAVHALLGIDEERLVAEQLQANMGGNTSVRSIYPSVWKDKGYYQRNRDLGQVFVAPRDITLDSIVLRTGNDSLAYLSGTAGSKVFVQFFTVSGEPKIDDNGTPVGSKAKHGFSTNHRCDDYLRGIEFESLLVCRGGTMPKLSGDGKLTYLKWQFTGEHAPRFKKGNRYAFMVGFEEPGEGRGFTLANMNRASSPEPPSLVSAGDTYPDGWGLRREGNGKLPPTMIPGAQPPTDKAKLEQLQAESLFAEGAARFELSPTSDGYPDVDTYRDLEFYLIAKP